MPKYINADELLEQMKDRRFYVGRRSDPICIIEDTPAAAVEPVIHCKDCIHGCPAKGHEPDIYCSWWDYPMPPLGFCSKAGKVEIYTENKND